MATNDFMGGARRDSKQDGGEKPALPGATRAASGRLGMYALKHELGVGPSTVVYVAQRIDTRSIVQWATLKVLRPELAQRADVVDGFLEQAHKAAQVRHPYVSQPIDVGMADGTPYVASEFIIGESFSRFQALLVGKHAEVSVSYVCELVARCAEGVHAAHIATAVSGGPLDLVHRNICPNNLFAVQDGSVRVLDFGVSPSAKLRGAPDKVAGPVKGAYMAPELLKTRGIDRRSDIWSLGVVLWEMLAGRALFRKNSEVRMAVAVLEEAIDPPSRHNPAVPSALDEVVMRALQRDRQQRYQTAAQLATELRTAATRAFGPMTTRALSDWVTTLFGSSLASRAKLVGARALSVTGDVSPRRENEVSREPRAHFGPSFSQEDAANMIGPTRKYSSAPMADVPHPVVTFGLLSEVEFESRTIIVDSVSSEVAPVSDAPPKPDLAAALEPDLQIVTQPVPPVPSRSWLIPALAAGLALTATSLTYVWNRHATPVVLPAEPASEARATTPAPQQPAAETPKPVQDEPAAAEPAAPIASARAATAAPAAATGKPVSAPKSEPLKARPTEKAPAAPAAPNARAKPAATADRAATGEVYVTTQATDIFVSAKGAGREAKAPSKLRLPAGSQTLTIRHAQSGIVEQRVVQVFADATVMLHVK